MLNSWNIGWNCLGGGIQYLLPTMIERRGLLCSPMPLKVASTRLFRDYTWHVFYTKLVVLFLYQQHFFKGLPTIDINMRQALRYLE